MKTPLWLAIITGAALFLFSSTDKEKVIATAVAGGILAALYLTWKWISQKDPE